MIRTLGLLVPSLDQGGGVPSVARFIKDAAERDGNWKVRSVSLCMSSNDPESISLRQPITWQRGIQVGKRQWLGAEVPHVGAFLGELEFQRYRPRRPLSNLVAGCDVIQVVSGSPAWANTVLGLHVPISLQVATLTRVERRMRDRYGNGTVGLWRRWMTAVTDRLDERALRRVDAIQVENPWMMDYVHRINKGRKTVDIRYAPPGVDAVLFRPAQVRNVESGHVLCVGRLDDPRKNVGLLLEAYAHMSPDIREQHPLVLAGATGPGEAFWQRAHYLGVSNHIRYVHKPSSEELVTLYQQASAFVLSSDEEGLGIVVLEAMACAIPVVSTRCGGPDGIITDEYDGFLVPLDDDEAVAQRLKILLENQSLNIEMGHKARKTIEARFDERLAGAVFVDVWNQLADAHNLY